MDSDADRVQALAAYRKHKVELRDMEAKYDAAQQRLETMFVCPDVCVCFLRRLAAKTESFTALKKKFDKSERDMKALQVRCSVFGTPMGAN